MGVDAELRQRWAATRSGDDTLGAELLRRWSEPHRVYHDTRHLLDVLEAIDGLAALAEDPAAVRLAAWFHDAVYDVAAPDNEERSAQLAQQRLPGPTGATVGRLVRLTATHDPGDDDPDGQVLCDADLAVLGASPDRYAAYAEGVRREHSAVSDAEFAPARADILRKLLDRPRLYRTDPAHERWERQARLNVAHEVSRLQA